MLQETDLETPGALLTQLTSMLREPDQLAAMAAAARTQAHPDAAERIADRLVALSAELAPQQRIA